LWFASELMESCSFGSKTSRDVHIAFNMVFIQSKHVFDCAWHLATLTKRRK